MARIMRDRFGVRSIHHTGYSADYSEWLTKTEAIKTAKELAREYPESVFEVFNRDDSRGTIVYRSKQHNPSSKSSKWFPVKAARVLPNGAVQVRVVRAAGKHRNPSNTKVRVYIVASVHGVRRDIGTLHETLQDVKQSFKEQGIKYNLLHLGGQGSGAVYEAIITKRP